jgi:cation diffusion facilitator family transporter
MGEGLSERVKSKEQTIRGPLTGFLVRKVIDPAAATNSHENRTRLGILEGWVSTVLSLALCLLKGWLGLLSGSVSLLADATNNLTDVGSSLAVAFGFQWSRKPSDEEHPFGHGRIEAVATLVLSIALLVVGAEVAKSGADRLLNPQPIEAPGWLLVAVFITVAVKLWLALFARSLARISGSHVLEADSWNHVFDVASTILVMAALLSARAGWPGLDGWMAIAVAAFIFLTGIKYAREAIDILLGKKPDTEELSEIHRIVDAVEGVLGVHEIMVHQYGDVKMVSFHIEVTATLTVIDAHHIAEAAEDAVEHQLQWRALAHVDPVDRSHPFFDDLHAALNAHVSAEPDLSDFHDLRAEGDRPPYRISVDLVTEVGTQRERYAAIFERIQRRLEETFPDRIGRATIGIEAPVESAPMIRRKLTLHDPSGK